MTQPVSDSSDNAATLLPPTLWSRTVTAILISGMLMFVTGAIMLSRLSNSVRQFVGVQDRMPMVTSIRYTSEILLVLGGLLILFVALRLGEGSRRRFSAVMLRLVREWKARPFALRLLWVVAVLIIVTAANYVSVMTPAFARTTENNGWDLRYEVYRGARESQLISVIQGLALGCLLCDGSGQPLENVSKGDDIGIYAAFGILAKLGIVPVMISGYQMMVAATYAISVLLGALMFAYGSRSLVAGALFAVLVSLLDDADQRQSILITTYWVQSAAAILSGGLALGVLGRLLREGKSASSNRFYWIAFGVWGLAAGLAYLGRSSAGTATLLGAGLVWLIVVVRGRRYIPALIGLVLMGFGWWLPGAAFRYTLEWRFQAYPYMTAPIENTTLSHPFSHAILVGLGYVTNDYGLYWLDTVGRDMAEQECPGVGYLSPAYYDCVRDIVVRLLRDDPGLYIRSVLVKIEAILQSTFTFLWVAFWLPLAFFLLRKPIYYLVFIAVAGINVLPSLLTVPYYLYLQGYYQTIVVFVAAGVILYLLQLSEALVPTTVPQRTTQVDAPEAQATAGEIAPA